MGFYAFVNVCFLLAFQLVEPVQISNHFGQFFSLYHSENIQLKKGTMYLFGSFISSIKEAKSKLSCYNRGLLGGNNDGEGDVHKGM